MNELERLRHQMDRELRRPGEHPDPGISITRRLFLHRSLLAGGALAAGAYGSSRFPA